MVNLDTRILDKVNENELWLILHVAKRMQNNRMTAWPSLATLVSDTRWQENTVRRWRKSLVDKGYLSIEERSGQSSIYRFTLSGIGVFQPLEGEHKEENPSQKLVPSQELQPLPKIGTPPSQKLVPHPYQKLVPELVNNISTLTKDLNKDNVPVSENGNAAMPPSPTKADEKLFTLEEKKEKAPSIAAPPQKTKPNPTDATAEVINHLNQAINAKRGFSVKSKTNIGLVNARINDGATVDEMKLIISHKVFQWLHLPEMSQHLCPQTLLCAGHYEKYLIAALAWQEAGNNPTGSTVPRYSLQDRPANVQTPDDMMKEIRKFYNANPDILADAKRFAGVSQIQPELCKKFCARQIADGRNGDTFQALNGRLQTWLLNETKAAQAGPMPQQVERTAQPVFHGRR